MLQRLFYAGGGPLPVPRLPRDFDGTPRVANGRDLLDVPQAAERFDMPAESLSRLWDETWLDLVTPEDREAIERPRRRRRRRSRRRDPRVVAVTINSAGRTARVEIEGRPTLAEFMRGLLSADGRGAR